jgi:hypothetical protein
MKRVILVAAIFVGVCVAYVLAHLALIEVGREVVVVHEPTPGGGIRFLEQSVDRARVNTRVGFVSHARISTPTNPE